MKIINDKEETNMYMQTFCIESKDILNMLSNEDRRKFNQCIFTGVQKLGDGSLNITCAFFEDDDFNEKPEKRVKLFSNEAEWQYWDGWGGNHDKRIDDAKCSKCGYVHPIVKGSPNFLSNYCPDCGSKMKK